MDIQRELKICAGASAGGHLRQLLSLLEHASVWPAQPSCFLVTMPELANTFDGNVHVVGECNRKHIVSVLKVLIKTFKVIKKERPDVIISTGSMPIALACIWTKLFGGKVIWIDSITNIEKMSVSGRLVRRFADKVFVQWEHLTQKYTKVEYAGFLV